MIDTNGIRDTTAIVGIIERYVELKQRGSEWVGLCPFHQEKTPSFHVVPAKQFYHCFGCGAHGDVIAFVMEMEQVDFKTAIARLGNGLLDPDHKPTPRTPPADLTPEWTPILPVPADAPALMFDGQCKVFNPKRDKFSELTPSRVDQYHDAAGHLLGYVLRVDFKDGEKFTPTVTYCQRLPSGERRWCMVAFQVPRPLQNLGDLAIRSAAGVIVVEGEKARQAAERLFQKYVCVTWPGGTNGVGHADFRPLYGKDVILWPDADEPGRAAMLAVGEILRDKASRIRLLDPTGKPSGWDAADAVREGMDAKTALTWAKASVRLLPEPAPPDTGGHAEPGPVDVPRGAELSGITPSSDSAQSSGITPSPNSAQISKPKPRRTPKLTVVGNTAIDSQAQHEQSIFTRWDQLGLEMGNRGNPLQNLDNLVRVLTKEPDLAGKIWWDHFHGLYYTEWRGPRREWSDSDDLLLAVYMQRELGLSRVSDELAHKAVRTVGQQQARNEPKDWISGLSWDGQDRIYTFLTAYFGVKDAEYSRAIAKNFWISLVARVFDPGCKVDNMLVLEAAQGAKKSSALQVIGGSWYTEANESVMSKDFFIGLRGKLIVEIGELDSFSRAENTRVKQVITCRTDRYRDPYARAAADHPRQNVFVGTTNDDAYLRDVTGGRRFWPARCKSIDLDALQADRSQLYAQALQLYRDKISWWEVPGESTAAQQEFRRMPDVWESTLEDYLHMLDETTMRDCLAALDIDTADADMKSQYRVANAMRILGWEKRTARIGGKLMKVWRRNEGKPAAALDN